MMVGSNDGDSSNELIDDDKDSENCWKKEKKARYNMKDTATFTRSGM